MQFQADVSDTNVIRPACVETTASRAAYLAGLSTGYWKDYEDIKKNCIIDNVFESTMDNQIRQQLFAGWKQAIGCALAYDNN